MEIRQFFANLWRDYTALTPQAEVIHQAFAERNGEVINDHVAFRTFNLAPVGIEQLETHLLCLGYRRFATYQFVEKKLSAWSYRHDDEHLPLLFFSELRVEELSAESQAIIHRLLAHMDKRALQEPAVFWSGPPWPLISWDDYQTLLRESEYAAWLAALGFHANHFTIAVHFLALDNTIEKAIDVVKACGFPLNQAGGEIKGEPSDYLVQASTLADRVLMRFGGGDEHEISTCYYELAQRYRLEDGHYYQGFVATSADKIFESTAQHAPAAGARSRGLHHPDRCLRIG